MNLIKEITAEDLYGENHKYESKIMEVELPNANNQNEVYEIHVYQNDILIPHFHIVKGDFDCALCIYTPNYYGEETCSELSDQQLETLYKSLTRGNGFGWNDIAARYYREVTEDVEDLIFGMHTTQYINECPYFPNANCNVKIFENEYYHFLKMYLPLIYQYESITKIKDVKLDGELFRIRINFDKSDSETFSVENEFKSCEFMLRAPKYSKRSKDKLSASQIKDLHNVLIGQFYDLNDIDESTYQMILDTYDISEDLICPDYNLISKEE